MSDVLAFIRLPEVWKDGIVPEEFREKLNLGSNAPGVENDWNYRLWSR